MSTSSSSSSPPSSIPWSEKYRPPHFTEVVGNPNAVQTVQRMARCGQLPNLLLYGPPGTGKTSTVIAAAREMYGEDCYKQWTMELNASDDRKIQTVREAIRTFASSRLYNRSKQKSASAGTAAGAGANTAAGAGTGAGTAAGAAATRRLVILDEMDAMRNEAQFALRGVIELFSLSTSFVIICNHVTKIVASIQSRCQMIKFASLSEEAICQRLLFVARSEGIADRVDDAVYPAIVTLVDGDLRKAINLLQAASAHIWAATDDSAAAAAVGGAAVGGATVGGAAGGGGSTRKRITPDQVYLCAGQPPPTLVSDIANGLLFVDAVNVRGIQEGSVRILEKILAECLHGGYALLDVLRALFPYVFEHLKSSADTTLVLLPHDKHLIHSLSRLESQLHGSSTDIVQCAGLVAIFTRYALMNRKTVSLY